MQYEVGQEVEWESKAHKAVHRGRVVAIVPAGVDPWERISREMIATRNLRAIQHAARRTKPGVIVETAPSGTSRQPSLYFPYTVHLRAPGASEGGGA